LARPSRHKNSPRGVSVGDLEADRQRRDALLWNFTVVLGEAAGQLSDDVKTRFPGVMWQQPVRLRNRIVHGYWSVDLESCIPPPASSSRHSPPTCGMFSTPSVRAPDLEGGPSIGLCAEATAYVCPAA
jgi:hypothetical protein